MSPASRARANAATQNRASSHACFASASVRSVVGRSIGPGDHFHEVIVGVVESLAAGYLDPYVGGGTKDFAPYLLMILVLMVRPYGIFGKRQIERV